MLAGIWIGTLALLVGSGLLGRGGEAPARPVPTRVEAAASARPEPPRAQAPAWVTGPPERLTMTIPGARNVSVSTRTVEVAGTLDGGAGRVVVSLESRRSHLLEARTVSVLDGRFRTSFVLPNPRPGGRMWVSAVLLGPMGLPLEAIRRPIVSGPLAQRILGEDGLVGGIVFGGPTVGRTRPE